jgi:hypothetical protein
VGLRAHSNDSTATNFSIPVDGMTYITPVVSSSKKMNKVNKDLVIQEPVESIAS